MQNKESQEMESPDDLYSTCPSGEAFPIPKKSDHEAEFERVRKIVEEQRGLGGRS